MSNQPQRPPIKPTPLDVMSTWMYAEPVAGSQRRPNLRMKVIGNVPRMVVKTNVQDDKNNGRIDMNLDTATFSVMLYQLDQLASGKTDRVPDLQYNDDFVAGKKMDKQLTLGTIKMGKASDGRIYIGIHAHDRPKVQFFFGPSKYHAMVWGDGSPVDPGAISAAYAMGWKNSMDQLVHGLLVSEFNVDAKNVAKPPSMQQGGQGGGQGGGFGGGNGNRNGGGQDFGGDFGNVEDFNW